jgi:hypothetical protein
MYLVNVYEDEKVFIRQNTYSYVGYIIGFVIGYVIINTIFYVFV